MQILGQTFRQNRWRWREGWRRSCCRWRRFGCSMYSHTNTWQIKTKKTELCRKL